MENTTEHSIEEVIEFAVEIRDTCRNAEERLRSVSWLQAAVQDMIAADVRMARFAGASWADVAGMLGTTRQAAWERYREIDA